jgi:photosystem II stability/assembly factor-like uncharacterized protein
MHRTSSERWLPLIVCLVSFTIDMGAQVAWAPVTPLEGGRTIAIVRKASNGYLFTGTENDGVYRSSNEGALWTACSNGLLAHGVRDLVLASDGSLYTAQSSNVYRSVDDGASWQPCNTKTGTYALASDNGGRVFAGTDSGLFRSSNNGVGWVRVNTNKIDGKRLVITPAGHLFVATRDSGVFRSLDDGGTWTKVSAYTNHILYADMLNGDVYLGNGFSPYVYRSTDDGNSWVELAQPKTPTTSWPVTMIYRHPVTRTLFVATDVLWESHDAGASWQRVFAPFPTKWKSSMAASGSTGALLGGTGGIHFCPDSSNVWQTRNTGLCAVPITAMVADPGAVYFGSSSNGISRSASNGGSWTNVSSGLENTTIQSLAHHPPSNTLFAGTSEGLYRSSNGGGNWTFSDSGLAKKLGTIRMDNSVWYVTTHPSGSMFAFESWRDAIYRSTDAGRFWTNVNNGLPDTLVSAMAISNAGPYAGRIYMGTSTSKIFHSSNEGATWQQDTAGLPTNGQFNSIITSDKTGTVVTHTNSWIYRSEDGGAHWTKVFMKSGLQRFAVHRSSGQMFIVTSPVGPTSTLYRSADDGLTWQDAGTIQTNYAAPRIMTDSGGYLWAGHQHGGEIFRTQQVVPVTFTSFTASLDDGHALLRWSTVYEARNHGFSIEKESAQGEWNSIGFVPGAGNSGTLREYGFTDPAVLTGTATYRLRQTDFDGSVQYSSEVVVEEAATIAAFALLGSSPSPAHGESTVRFSMAAEGRVAILVHDLLGRERVKLIDEDRAAGTHMLRFDAYALSPGCYLLTARSGSATVQRTMVVR